VIDRLLAKAQTSAAPDGRMVPMRLAAALVLLIFAVMATSVAGTNAARSETLSAISESPAAY
jgi:hypothetical protein